MKPKQHQKILKLIVIFIFFISITLLFCYYTQSNSIEFMSVNLSKFFQLPKITMPKISMPKFLKNINFPNLKLLRKNKIPLNQTNTNTNRYRDVLNDKFQKLKTKVTDIIKETKKQQLDINNPTQRRQILQNELTKDPKFQELRDRGIVKLNQNYGSMNDEFQYPYIFKGDFSQYLQHKEDFLKLNSNFTKSMETKYGITDKMINPAKNFDNKYDTILYQLKSDPEYRMLQNFGVKINTLNPINPRFEMPEFNPKFGYYYSLEGEVKRLNSRLTPVTN